MFISGPDGIGLMDNYFTSGSDYQLSGNFIWCSSNYTPFGSSVFWSVDEPSFTDNFGNEESCTSVHMRTGLIKKNTFRDVECAGSMKFICEVYFLVEQKTRFSFF